jgi:hypothetical protein
MERVGHANRRREASSLQIIGHILGFILLRGKQPRSLTVSAIGMVVLMESVPVGGRRIDASTHNRIYHKDPLTPTRESQDTQPSGLRLRVLVTEDATPHVESIRA